VKNLQKIYVSILCSIVLIYGSISPLKGQGNENKVWDSMSEGTFEITNNYRTGDYIVMTTVLEKGVKPATIDGQISIQPITVWDLQNDSFVSFNSNWVGDAMNPVKMFMFDSSRLFITDGVKIVRADIDFQYKTISYQQTFQGDQGVNLIRDMFIDKVNEKIYFISSYLKHYLYICNMSGEIQDAVQIIDPSIYLVRSIVKWKDTIYFGYDYMGGLADGSGLAILDPVSGQITKLRDPLWMNNANGCQIKVIDDHFYLTTDAAKYYFRQTLFEYTNSVWKTVIVGAWMPDFRQGKTVVNVEKNGFYPNKDTINKTSGGLFYEFTNSLAGNEIPDDSRLDIQFSETFKTQFYHRNGFFPAIEFVYEIGNKIIGFGPSIVGKLIDLTSGIKTPKVRTVLNVYPNPATGETVYIQGLQKPTDYIITNTTGQTVAKGLTMEAVEISSLQPGIYFLSIPKIGATAKFVRN